MNRILTPLEMAAAVSMLNDDEHLDKLIAMGGADEFLQVISAYVVGVLGLERIRRQTERMRKGEVPLPPGHESLPDIEDIGIMVGGPEAVHPGSRKYPCVLCGCDVWIAPSGQHTVAQMDLHPCCIDCCASASGTDVISGYVTDEALQEFENWKKRN